MKLVVKREIIGYTKQLVVNEVLWKNIGLGAA